MSVRRRSLEQCAHEGREQSGADERREVALRLHAAIGEALAARRVIDDEVLFGLHRLSATLRAADFATTGKAAAQRLTPRQAAPRARWPRRSTSA
jgi:hypothetical protein